MDIYLPIAEVSVNWPLLVLLGATVGFVSGLFGIGGGFLMAPILIFLGIPPAVAVARVCSCSLSWANKRRVRALSRLLPQAANSLRTKRHAASRGRHGRGVCSERSMIESSQ